VCLKRPSERVAKINDRMNILVLCDRYPYPLENGQNLRIFHYVSQLQSEHTFDLICYGEAPAPTPILGLFRRIETFAKPPKRKGRGWRRLVEAFSIDKMFPQSPEVRDYLSTVVPGRDYDLIWVSGWGMIVNIPKSFDIPLLADVIDDGVLEYWNDLPSVRSPVQAVRTLKLMGMNYFFERKYFRDADHCLFVSEVDAAMFQRICPRTSVSVIHNGVDPEFFKPAGVGQSPASLVFEGKIGFKPNADGIRYFCATIFPLVLKAEPGARLTIVGKDPTPEVQALASSSVEVTGYVDDVRPYVDRAAVFVCPLRKGAGIKNKVLQAWSMAKPVVATTNSVGGLLVKEEENIMIRDNPQAFADAVVTLFRDEQLRRRMGATARKTILDSYSWRSKANRLHELFVLIVRDWVRIRGNGRA
jgi:glycosyltransferase involved in cell wall biosynthesis